jgi:hypothetical protein
MAERLWTDARVTISDEERDGEPAPEAVARACAHLLRSGAVVVDNLLPRALVERLAAAYFERYPALAPAHVDGEQYLTGPRRVMHPVPLAAPFDDPRLWASPFLLQLLAALLDGAPPVLSSFSAVVAQPGAPAQRTHRVPALRRHRGVDPRPALCAHARRPARRPHA